MVFSQPQNRKKNEDAKISRYANHQNVETANRSERLKTREEENQRGGDVRKLRPVGYWIGAGDCGSLPRQYLMYRATEKR
ncbi:unnamed protein product [Arabis nemorensis]|uniref:Uncharacterized protein n=1 Tax=Arabis nemorensis TaxID=586526 RepID=A0A565BKN6_9BRAS|nr:unnamed protein product [Arabis nemorensis]